jgi:hypothetical protein
LAAQELLPARHAVTTVLQLDLEIIVEVLKTRHFGHQACGDHAPLPQELLSARRCVLSVQVLVADVDYVFPDPNRERDKTDDGE